MPPAPVLGALITTVPPAATFTPLPPLHYSRGRDDSRKCPASPIHHPRRRRSRPLVRGDERRRESAGCNTLRPDTRRPIFHPRWRQQPPRQRRRFSRTRRPHSWWECRLRRSDVATIRADAGIEWDSVVRLAVENNCDGIECLAGIPGSVGGTPVQNVGAYGQEVSTTIERVRAVDLRD